MSQFLLNNRSQHSTAQHSTAQHSTAQHSTAQHSTAQHRDKNIDILRGIVIILMVIGHIGVPYKMDHFIHSFHMPIFFILSGMFFHYGGDLCGMIKKRSKSLLIPYIVFGLFHYMLVSRHNFELLPLKSLLFQNTDNLPIAGALWFLTALFFSNIVYFLCRSIKYKCLQNICIVAVSILGCMATSILPFRLPWALDAAFVGTGLMHIGWLIAKNRQSNEINNLLNLKIPLLVLLSVVSIVSVFVNGYINMRVGTYANIPLFWINIVLITISALNWAKYVYKFSNKRINTFLCNCGSRGIVFVVLNQLVILCFFKFVTINKLFVLCGSIFVLYTLSYVFFYSKLRLLIGKW